VVDLVRIGSIPKNRSGTGARGYRIRRMAKSIVVSWGGIEIHKKGNRTYYYWATGWPRERIYPSNSIRAAELRRKAEIIKRCGARLKYEKLPAAVRIRVRKVSG
jgi:hypothetical protein